jgi:hypothetical protein
MLVVVLGRVEHHFDHAFNMPVGWHESPDVDSEPTRNRRADLLAVEHLAFDFAGLQNVLRQRLEHGLIAKREAQTLHVADQSALPVADGSQGLKQSLLCPSEARPILLFVDISHLVFSASFAENIAPNLRTRQG